MSETYIGGLRLKERQLRNMKTVFFAADLICATYSVIPYPFPVLEIGDETGKQFQNLISQPRSRGSNLVVRKSTSDLADDLEYG